jgi:transmembrane sensor
MYNMEKYNSLYTNLLVKKFKGTLTAEETDQLDTWLQATEENRAKATDYQHIWGQVQSTELSDHALDLQQDFAQVMAKAKAMEQDHTVALKPVWQRTMLRVAAAVATLLVAVAGYYMVTKGTVNTFIVNATQDRHEVVLSDGTKVLLRSGAQLRYTSDFNKTKRIVELDGEAFFDVKHDNVNHFCVKTNKEEVIEVLGTTFNVQEGEKNTTVTVKEGKVRFSISSANQEIILTTGQQGEHNKVTSKLSRRDKINPNEFAWVTDELVFSDTPLSQAVKDLEKYYHVKIKIDNILLNQCPYSARLNGQSIQQVLEGLKTIFHFSSIEQNANDAFVLKGGNCDN